MYSFRILGLVTGVPGTYLLGVVGSLVIADALHVWEYYVAAVLTPVLGLSYAWFVSPPGLEKQAAAAYLAIGMVLALQAAFPAYYPETHPRSYEPTYVPFAITVTTALAYFGFLLALSSWRAARRFKSGPAV